MSLDRDELAARCLVAMMSNPNLVGSGKGVDDAVWWADALLAALVPVAPASGAPATEPRRTVGAVVRWHDDEFIVAESGDGLHAQQALKGGGFGSPCFDDVFDRWATREECEWHGIPYVARPLPGAPLAAPSPAATPAAWVPSVGDVVKWSGLRPDYIVTFTSPQLGGKYISDGIALDWFGGSAPYDCTFVRRATSSERAAAGLPVDESAVGWMPMLRVEKTQCPACGCRFDAIKAPAFDRAEFNEAWERDAFREWARTAVNPHDPLCAWLARARVAAKGGAS